MSGRLRLPQVTLAAMTSVNVDAAIKAMLYSMRGIEFGDAVLITHRKPRGLPKGIRYGRIERLWDIDGFNYHMVYDLGDYIDTEFAMVVHADGFVVNPKAWRDDFLDYDYIGAPWPLPREGDDVTYRDRGGNVCRVGNSVSIRSKRLMDFPKKAHVPWIGEYAFGKLWFHEDGFICCKIRHLIEAEGMSFAPLEVARFFGREHGIPENEGIEPFCFHKWEGENAKYPNFTTPSLRERLGAIHGKIVKDGLRLFSIF